MLVGEGSRPTCPALKQLDIHGSSGGNAVALDEDDMARFFAAREVLNCAAAVVNVHEPGRRKTYKSGSGQMVVT